MIGSFGTATRLLIDTCGAIGLSDAPVGWAVIWRPMLPVWMIAGLLGCAAVMTVMAYRSTGGGRIWAAGVLCAGRLFVLGVMTVVLLGPERRVDQTRIIEKPTLAVVVDTSGSMFATDVGGGSRINAVIRRYLTPQNLETWRERFDVRLLAFDEKWRAVGLGELGASSDHGGGSSRYTDSLLGVIETLADGVAFDESLPGSGEARVAPSDAVILLLGDGHDTASDGPDAVAQVADRRGIAIHTVAVGATESPPDIAVTAVARPSTLFAGEQGRLVVSVRGIGNVGPTTSVRVSGPGVDVERSVRFDENTRASLELPLLRDETGRIEYTVAAEPVSGESETRNNAQTVFVDVTGRRAAVLLLEGEPHWDTRAIAQALRVDGRVRLTQVSQIGPGRREILTDGEATPIDLPSDAEGWSAYDAVILGRGIERLLDESAADSLAAWVTGGGGRLVFARGKPYGTDTERGRSVAAALSGIEPGQWGRLIESGEVMKPTAAGGLHPAVSALQTMANGEDAVAPVAERVVLIDSIRAGAIVLAEVSTGQAETLHVPAMIEMSTGSGKVLSVLAEGLWRWRLRSPPGADMTTAFDRFWAGTVRSLATGDGPAPGRLVDLRIAAANVHLGDEVMVEAVSREDSSVLLDGVAAVVTEPSGQTRRLRFASEAAAANRRAVMLRADQVGTWRLALEARDAGTADALAGDQPMPSHGFTVRDPSVERIDTAARPGYLRELAELTGGMFVRFGEEIDLGESIARHYESRHAPEQTEPMWDRAWLMIGLLGWLCIEWISRRRLGWA